MFDCVSKSLNVLFLFFFLFFVIILKSMFIFGVSGLLQFFFKK